MAFTPPGTPTGGGAQTRNGGGFFHGAATRTPMKTKARRQPPSYLTPQPGGANMRAAGLNLFDDGDFARVGDVRPRAANDLEEIEQLGFRTESMVLNPRTPPRPTPRTPVAPGTRTPPRRALSTPPRDGGGAVTPERHASNSTSPRHGHHMPAWHDFGSTPSKPMRSQHRRVESTTSLGDPHGYSTVPRAAATPQPNVNPFATPARGAKTSIGRIVANDQMQAFKTLSSGNVASPQRTVSRSPTGDGAEVAPRYSFKHTLPWVDEAEQPEGGVYVPLHHDVNGTVWLATGLLDGHPYAVKEVPFSDSVGDVHAYSDKDIDAMAQDPLVRTEIEALQLSQRCEYIQRYYGVHHDPLLRLHVVRTAYCARLTLVDEVLQRQSGAENEYSSRSGSPLLGNPSLAGSFSVCARSFGGFPLRPQSRFGYPSQRSLVRIMGQVYQAVAMLHANDISHNALHPHNVLVDENGVCKVSQFGAARRVSLLADGTETLIGTLPVLYEPSGSTDWADGETPFSRDVYSFAAGMLHLISASLFQVQQGKAVEHLADVPMLSVEDLGRKYDTRVVSLFRALLDPNPARRPTAQAVVAMLAPPPPMMASLMQMCDVEAARLRARIAELKNSARAEGGSPTLRPGSTLVFASPIHHNNGSHRGSSNTSPSQNHLAPAALREKGDAGGSVLEGSMLGASGSLRHPGNNDSVMQPRTAPRQRPTALVLSASAMDMTAADDGGASPLECESVMSPPGHFPMRQGRMHAAASFSDIPTDSPMPTGSTYGGANGSLTGIPAGLLPRSAMRRGSAVDTAETPCHPSDRYCSNSFDDAPNEHADGQQQHRRPTSRLRFPTAPPQEATSPSRAREDTSVDLFGATPPAASALGSSPQPFHSPPVLGGRDTAATITPPLGVHQTCNGPSANDDEVQTAARCQPTKPADWSHGGHTETADEAVRILQQRMPDVQRALQPSQDMPRDPNVTTVVATTMTSPTDADGYPTKPLMFPTRSNSLLQPSLLSSPAH